MKFINCNQKKTLIIRRVFITFFLLTMLFSCSEKNQKVTFEGIVEQGYITIGTLYGANSFYAQGTDIQNNGMQMDAYAGFEYELAKQYADYLNVTLKIVPSYSLDELFAKLNSGEVDLLAAGLAVTEKRLLDFDFAPSYTDISQKLVFKQGNVRPREVSDLTGTLMVTASSSHVESLHKLKQVNPDLKWIETSDFDGEELLTKLLNDEIDYTIVDSNTLASSRRYYPEISIGFTIQETEPLAWMVNKTTDDAILASLVEFFGKVHHNGALLALDDKYYGHIEQFNYVETRTFIKAVKTRLPEYQDIFEKYSQEVDWRLLAAISYQESHWKPHARSHTGVRGMMMLTLATAKQMGIKSRLDVDQSIRGGSKYFRRMIAKMPDRIPNPDRIWFALASYNVGFGHLNDARIITQQQGGDPDRWVEVKARLPLLQQKKYYKNTKYGYARGTEPVHYVDNIRRYYDTLTWLDDKSQEAIEAAEDAEVLEAIEQELEQVTSE
jgi:membrane-bound lytic murein transglycosylase F